MCTPRICPAPAVGLLLGDDLDQSVELAEDLRPAVGPELVLGDDDVVSGLAGRLLRLGPENATSGWQ